jgi:hypothetical protein
MVEVKTGATATFHDGDDLGAFDHLPGRDNGAGAIFDPLFPAGATALLAIALSVSSSKSSTGRATRPFMTISKKAADIRTVWGRAFFVMTTGASWAASWKRPMFC